MKKKFLCVATASVLAVSMLAGCGNDSGSANNSSAPSNSAANNNSSAPADNNNSSQAAPAENSNLLPALSASEQGVPGHLTTPRSNYITYPVEGADGVTLTYWGEVAGNVQNNPATADSVQHTQWAELWVQNTGVNVEFTGPTSDVPAQFNLMTSSTKLPDIIEWEWTASYTGGPAAAEADGVLIWLDDYIKPDGPAADLWQYLQDNPTLDKSIKTDDGHYYCFPFVRGNVYLQTTSGPIVRKDLVEGLGYKLDDIVTIADWEEVLTALKDSGIEKPISCGSWSNLMTMFQGAYEFRDSFYIDLKTNKVAFGNTSDGYKEFLALMVDWKEKGLVDADQITNTNTERQNNVLGGLTAITYGAGGGQIGTWNQTAKKEPDKYGNFELTGIQFPVINKGDVVKYSGGSTDYAITSRVHAAITADCENPEIAAMFLNYPYSQAGHEVINFGIEGTDYTRNSDGTITYSDWIMDNPDGLTQAVAMANKGRANMSGAFVQDPNYIIGYWATDLQQRALHIWNDETDNQGSILPPVTLTADESTTYARIMADITTAVKEYYTGVFTGTKNLDSDWDAYVAQLEGMGLPDALKIQQDALDRYNAR